MTALSSDELNLLIFRYLHESGFTHAAFTFGFESGINKCSIDGNIVPQGALVTVIQKGLLYLEMEVNCDEDLDEDFAFLKPLDLITKDVHELVQMVRDRKKEIHRERKKGFVKENEGERVREREIHKRLHLKRKPT